MPLSVGQPTHLLEITTVVQRIASYLVKCRWLILLWTSFYFPVFLHPKFTFLKQLPGFGSLNLTWDFYQQTCFVWLQPSVPCSKQTTTNPTPIFSSHIIFIINFTMNCGRSCLSFLATRQQCEKKLENCAHSQAKTQLKHKN